MTIVGTGFEPPGEAIRGRTGHTTQTRTTHPEVTGTRATHPELDAVRADARTKLDGCKDSWQIVGRQPASQRPGFEPPRRHRMRESWMRRTMLMTRRHFDCTGDEGLHDEVVRVLMLSLTLEQQSPG